jgi:hypothetical protein
LPDGAEPGFLKKILGFGPIPCQVEEKAEDIGLIKVVDFVKIVAAAHLIR